MNYQKIYNQIIERAKTRVISGYAEKHHILPKCLGGGGLKDNLVKLTAREHYIVHLLLTKIHPGNLSLIYAFWMMSNKKWNKGAKSSRYYEEAKKVVMLTMRTKVGTPEAIKKMSESKKGISTWTGKKHREESRVKQSESAKNRIINEENERKRREGISKGHKGIKQSEEHRINGSKAKMGSKNPMFGRKGKNNPKSKPILQMDMNDNVIKEWTSSVEAQNCLGMKPGRLYSVIKSKSKTALGFRWKYKTE